MTTYLGKSCSFGLPRVPFVNCRQFMYLVISLLVLGAGCGIWLYQFLIIAYLFTLYIFEKGVFWSGLRRNSRVAKSEKWGRGGGCGTGGLSRGTYPYCPYMGVPTPPPSPGLGFCNFRLENEFRTNFNPILTKCWVKFVKMGNAIRVFTIF